MKCPMCEKEVRDFFQVRSVAGKPFLAADPDEGLLVYGPYGTPKEVICFTENGRFNYLHFRFTRGRRERLVRIVKIQ